MDTKAILFHITLKKGGKQLKGKQLSKKAQKKATQRIIHFKDILIAEEPIVLSKGGRVIRKWLKYIAIRTLKGEFIEG